MLLCSARLFYYFMLGVVLAVNARLLSRDPSPFDLFLAEFDRAQLLVWTGTGELPITQGTVDYLTRYFEKQGTIDRIGFDCSVSGRGFCDTPKYIVPMRMRLTQNRISTPRPYTQIPVHTKVEPILSLAIIVVATFTAVISMILVLIARRRRQNEYSLVFSH